MFRQCWDAYMIGLILLWVCIIVPFTVCFGIGAPMPSFLGEAPFQLHCAGKHILSSTCSRWSARCHRLSLSTGGLELFGDASFMLDILINCRTAYYNARGRLVSIRAAIARHYASTWLAVDILAAMPWDTVFSVYHASNFLNLVKIARLFRLLRMVKAVKLRHLATTPAFLSSLEVRCALCFRGQD